MKPAKHHPKNLQITFLTDGTVKDVMKSKTFIGCLKGNKKKKIKSANAFFDCVSPMTKRRSWTPVLLKGKVLTNDKTMFRRIKKLPSQFLK